MSKRLSADTYKRFLSLWRLLPTRVQKALVYLGSPKATVGVAALILDDEERHVLLVHHTYRDPAWDFPSGLIERGEQPDDALRRELREEVGLNATIGPLLRAVHHTRGRHLTLYYRVSVTGPIRYSAEIDGARYVAIDDLTRTFDPTAQWWLRDLLTAVVSNQ